MQIAFGPRRNSGYGLTDGEGIERLWSYLRGFSSITKEMTCGRRIDVLTDALLHYAKKRLQQFGLFCNCILIYAITVTGKFSWGLLIFYMNWYFSSGPSFISNLRKAKNLMENAMEQLQEIFSKLTGTVGNTFLTIF